jgi:small subunit ribosomal protein S20
MANHRSAEKRHRQSLKRRARNKHRRSVTRGAVRTARAAIATGQEGAEGAVRTAEQLVARAASRGIFHWRKAARTASRLQRALNAARQRTAAQS